MVALPKLSHHMLCVQIWGFFITNASCQPSLTTTRSNPRKMVLVTASRNRIWSYLGFARGFNDACDLSSLGHFVEMYRPPEFWKEITVSEPIRIRASQLQCDWRLCSHLWNMDIILFWNCNEGNGCPPKLSHHVLYKSGGFIRYANDQASSNGQAIYWQINAESEMGGCGLPLECGSVGAWKWVICRR